MSLLEASSCEIDVTTGLAIREWSALVVDDVRAMRAIVRSILRGLGIPEIKEASCGETALQILEGQRVDLVITDLVMQPMDGLELTRKIRTPGNPFAFVPVLMISGCHDEASIKTALSAGITDYLIKPLTPIGLARKLNSLVLRPRPNVRLKNYWGPDRRRRKVSVRHDRRGLVGLD
ncbi:MAG: response regulator [Alphaproteobacteria bacterium]|nr:response regulator [Alphaproteobacteria bacterium]